MRRRGQVEDSAIPNTFAYIALFGWPLVCIGLFAMLRVEQAAIWSLLGGFLLLPTGTQVDLPLLPPLDKDSIPAISAVLLCWMKGSPVRAPRQSPLVYLLALCYVLAPIFTSLGNSYELQTGGVSVQGFYPVDGLKTAGRNLMLLGPFYIGARFLCTDDARNLLLRSFVASALFYSLPMLFEIRMSPQLHSWVYGYFPHQFAQTVRDGGFRPVVFMAQGLQAALFVAMAVIAAAVLARRGSRVLQTPAAWSSAYLSVILLLCKTLGTVLYAAVMAPVVMFTRPRTWAKVACVVLLIVCSYPALRTFNVIPVHHISDAAMSISEARSSSFDTRVRNEDMLLAKANQKPLFGWGTYGRSRIYDPVTGQDISITDGGWIIEYGTYGWFGYLSLFGLLGVAGVRGLRGIGKEVTPAAVTIGGLGLLLAINILDMLPNANMSPITLLLAGSIAGLSRVRVQSRSGARRALRRVRSPEPVTATR